MKRKNQSNVGKVASFYENGSVREQHKMMFRVASLIQEIYC